MRRGILPLLTPSFPAEARACFVSTGSVVNMVDAVIVRGASFWPSSDSPGEVGVGESGCDMVTKRVDERSCVEFDHCASAYLQRKELTR